MAESTARLLADAAFAKGMFREGGRAQGAGDRQDLRADGAPRGDGGGAGQ
ncbi:MAG TPA: hypothetical protein VGR37_19360 [Longimicrobiaceae bacterium]|nr:hypothetical protein [Longimicrobiaceae bacterium]